MFSLMHTDFRYIVITLLVMVAACFLAAAYNDYLSCKADGFEPVVLRDWTYRDDRGNTFVVTSTDITDNYSLLIEEYGLSVYYLRNHVFLADVKDFA